MRWLYLTNYRRFVEARIAENLDAAIAEAKTAPPLAAPDELRSRYGPLYDELFRVLLEEDPMGLIEIGAPKDEYTPEVATILPRLENCHSKVDVRQVAYEEFVYWFSDDGPIERYDRIAERIWELLLESRQQG
jgi:hypothetical protein